MALSWKAWKSKWWGYRPRKRLSMKCVSLKRIWDFPGEDGYHTTTTNSRFLPGFTAHVIDEDSSDHTLDLLEIEASDKATPWVQQNVNLRIWLWSNPHWKSVVLVPRGAIKQNSSSEAKTEVAAIDLVIRKSIVCDFYYQTMFWPILPSRNMIPNLCISSQSCMNTKLSSLWTKAGSSLVSFLSCQI